VKKRAIYIIVALLLGPAVFAVFASTCLNKAALTEEPNQDLLPVILEGTKTAVSSISSGAGKVVVHDWYRRESGELLETETTYTVAFSGDKLKASGNTRYEQNQLKAQGEPGLRSMLPGTEVEKILAYDGEKIIVFMPTKRTATIGDAKSSVAHELRNCRFLVGIPGHGLVDMSKDAYLPDDTRSDPRIVGRETIGGDECVVVEVVDNKPLSSGGQVKHTSWCWVNPSRGYMVVRTRAWAEGGSFKSKTLVAETVTDVRPYSVGIWGPAQHVSEQYRLKSDSEESYLAVRTTTTYDSDYQLNSPVSSNDLRIGLPSGTKVYDEVLQARYTVP
jgi:hypothetical protein